MKMVLANVKIVGFQRCYSQLDIKDLIFKILIFQLKKRIITKFVINFKDETKQMKKEQEEK